VSTETPPVEERSAGGPARSPGGDGDADRDDVDREDFDRLVAEAEAASVDGWDFSWLDGRASEQRPSWGYARLLADRLATAEASLDLETGGGEVLDRAARLPRLAVATESWPPNLARATARLHPRGVVVVRTDDGAPLPFADAAFDLVSSRHPVVPRWTEIARVLRPGGTYLAQHVGPASLRELFEYFLGPQQPEVLRRRHPDEEAAGAVAAGLHLVQLRTESLRVEFGDIGAVVWFLRKVIWIVPGFTVAAYLDRLRELHAQILEHGPFVARSTRTLVEAVRGDDPPPDPTPDPAG
jgi:SAM-dependent methyltransferase